MIANSKLDIGVTHVITPSERSLRRSAVVPAPSPERDSIVRAGSPGLCRRTAPPRICSSSGTCPGCTSGRGDVCRGARARPWRRAISSRTSSCAPSAASPRSSCATKAPSRPTSARSFRTGCTDLGRVRQAAAPRPIPSIGDRARSRRPVALRRGGRPGEHVNDFDAAFSRLSVEDQDLIFMRMELGYSYEDIAAMLGRATPNAIRVATRRAMLRLAKEMSVSGPTPDDGLIDLVSSIDDDRSGRLGTRPSGSARTDEERATIRELRLLSDIARVYRDPDSAVAEPRSPISAGSPCPRCRLDAAPAKPSSPNLGTAARPRGNRARRLQHGLSRARSARPGGRAQAAVARAPRPTTTDRRRILREGRLLGRLSHPNVVVGATAQTMSTGRSDSGCRSSAARRSRTSSRRTAPRRARSDAHRPRSLSARSRRCTARASCTATSRRRT